MIKGFTKARFDQTKDASCTRHTVGYVHCMFLIPGIDRGMVRLHESYSLIEIMLIMWSIIQEIWRGPLSLALLRKTWSFLASLWVSFFRNTCEHFPTDNVYQKFLCGLNTTTTFRTIFFPTRLYTTTKKCLTNRIFAMTQPCCSKV